MESLGGKLDSFYFDFGDVDAYSIVDLPDNASAAALSLVVAQSGAVATKTVVLLTPEEMDAARNKTVDYRPPAAERAPFAGALPARRPFVLGRCAAARP